MPFMEMVKVQAALAYLSSDNARPVVGCGDASADPLGVEYRRKSSWLMEGMRTHERCFALSFRLLTLPLR